SPEASTQGGGGASSAGAHVQKAGSREAPDHGASELVARHQPHRRHAPRGRTQLEERSVAMTRTGDEVETAIEVGVAEVEAVPVVILHLLRLETLVAEREVRTSANVWRPACRCRLVSQ